MPQLPMTGNILAGGRVVEGAGLDGVLTWDGTPTDGANGSFAGMAAPLAILVDVTTGTYYKNTGTQASPTWVAI